MDHETEGEETAPVADYRVIFINRAQPQVTKFVSNHISTAKYRYVRLFIFLPVAVNVCNFLLQFNQIHTSFSIRTVQKMGEYIFLTDSAIATDTGCLANRTVYHFGASHFYTQRFSYKGDHRRCGEYTHYTFMY